MTVLLPNSAFIHIPKCGGMWVRRALRESHLYQRRLNLDSSIEGVTYDNQGETIHNIPFMYEEFSSKDHIFTFVRHPVSWYQSYWAFRMSRGWEKKEIDQCKSFTFSKFIDNVIDTFPNGYLTQMYDFYTAKCTFVGKQENLLSDLIMALNLAGEQFDVTVFDKIASVNVTPKQCKTQAVYEINQIDKVLEVENDLLTKFEYDKFSLGYWIR